MKPLNTVLVRWLAALLCVIGLPAVAQAQNINLSPTSLSYGTVAVGATSSAQTVTVRNSDKRRTVNNLAWSTQDSRFRVTTSSCGVSGAATLGPNASCTISVVFEPNASGLLSSTLRVSGTNAAARTVSLSGTGGSTNPSIAVSPTALNFVDVAVNSTSPVQTVAVTNDGGQVINGLLASISSSSFATTTTGVANACTNFLDVGATCQIGVTFSPTSSGGASATLVISAANLTTPTNVSLTGTGVLRAALALSPVSLSFGNIAINTNSEARWVEVRNDGGVTLSGLSFSSSNAVFTFTTSGAPGTACTQGGSITGGMSCFIGVVFSPTARTTYNASLNVNGSNAAAPVSAAMSGTGTGIELSTYTLNFGMRPVGSSTSLPVTLYNRSSTDVKNARFTVTSPYSVSGCGGTIRRNSSCQLTVTFRPNEVRDYNGFTLGISTTAGAATVTLNGTGEGSIIQVTPTTLDFGYVAEKTTNTLAVRVRNVGNAVLRAIQPSTTLPYRASQNYCAGDLAPGAGCDILIEFKPMEQGTFNGYTLSITSTALNGAQIVTLNGISIGPFSSVTPGSLLFDRRCGVPGYEQQLPQEISVSNTGAYAMVISQLSVTGPNPGSFTVPTTCPLGGSLSPGGSCTITVTYVGTSLNMEYATLTVVNSGGDRIVELAGACSPTASP